MEITCNAILRTALATMLLTSPLLRSEAVIANPEPQTVIQPDGSKVTLQLYGDEYFNYTLTSDGYQVVYNPESLAWEYATLSVDGELAPSGQIAATGKTNTLNVKGLITPANQLSVDKRRAGQARVLGGGRYDYSKFRGLVILVEYNDAPFSRSDIYEIFDEMVNKRGYDGYMTNNLLPSKVEYTGSVRDYYYENSNGAFDPKFDVVGPVKINYSQHFARKSSGAQTLVVAALRAANDQIDYSLYDTDGNREVDMVYFIFSGGGSNFSGNPETLIWPHASTVMNLSLDGVSFGRYACSTELYGVPANKVLDGIGTICHEFSHVLGLPDLYDVDYETGGQADHPAKWSVMASGSYLNMSRTPCGYSLYERYSLGFTAPRVITEAGDYTINPLNEGDTPDGCRINSANDGEYFLLESRIKTRWDEYLPGEGLLVHRVDSTNPAIWENNRVNATSDHTYYTLLRATPNRTANGITDTNGDPFPGSGNVTAINNSTTPSLRSWANLSSPIVIENITVDADGAVSFKAVNDEVPTLVEDFALMSPTTQDAKGVEGRFTSWDFTKGARIELMADAATPVLTTVKGSEAQSGEIDATVENVAITITNPTTSPAVFRLYSSTDGKTWKPVSTVEGSSNPSVKKGETVTLHYTTGSLQKPAFRLAQYSGNATSRCIVSKIELSVKPGSGTAGIGSIEADFSDAPAQWYNLQGRPISKPTAPGIYIKVEGGKAKKIAITSAN